MILLEGCSHKGMYELPLQGRDPRSDSILSVECASMDTWHHHLAHLNHDALTLLTENEQIFVTNSCQGKQICKPCIVSKSHRFPHSH